MSESAWEPMTGELWWPWPLDEAGVAALMQEITDRSLLGAFAAGQPEPGQTVVEMLLARNGAGRVAVLGEGGEAVPGPDYRMLAQSFSLALGAAVDMDGFSYQAPAAEAAFRLAEEPELGDPGAADVEDLMVLRTVLVGQMRHEDLVMFGALNRVELQVLEDEAVPGRSVVVVEGEAAPGLYNWPAETKPLIALMNLDGLRAVEVWLPGAVNDPRNNFWHAWQPQPKPFATTDKASAEALRLLGTLVRSTEPSTAGIAQAFELNAEAESRLRDLMQGPEDGEVLARTAVSLGLPELAGRLAEAPVATVGQPVTVMPPLPMAKALLEVIATPTSGQSPFAKWHRTVLAHPELLAGSAAVAAGAAAVLFRAAARQGSPRNGIMRAGALSLVTEAAGELVFYSFLKSRRNRRR
ncbi:hypothetical protein [Arthrobacter crystallopoietes]|uniref:Uncharacterized protein n=1 Tax=Crystallibacter crystallopoietes TaxID=37928 RepID=A0A1H1G5F3_9MICC|nr:hypothetical protein [Arthrobacter crystallopoietes]SDR08421.1 hypothetical protein SAMN04489742_3858 [Arthrobacter crystallopoietes]